MTSRLRNSVLLAGMVLMSAAFSSADPATNPAPGEEIMRPTSRGMRLTWPIARYASQAWMMDMLWRDLELTEDQQAHISEAAAKRGMKLAHQHAAEMQPLVEQVIEIAMQCDGRQMTSELARAFSQTTTPMIPVFREWVGGIAADSRPVLKPEQQKRLEARLERLNAATSEFERRMGIWKDGQYKEGEDPFDGLEVAGEVASEPEPDVKPELRRARESANWEMQWEKRSDRAMFLAIAGGMFQFDDAQRARGQALLEEYARRTVALRTPEWEARVRRNRMANYLQQFLDESVPRGWWMRRLQREFDELNRPNEELDRAFYADVLRMATTEQWASLREEVRKTGDKYGFSGADTEGLIQRLAPPPASQPERGASS